MAAVACLPIFKERLDRYSRQNSTKMSEYMWVVAAKHHTVREILLAHEEVLRSSQGFK